MCKPAPYRVLWCWLGLGATAIAGAAPPARTINIPCPTEAGEAWSWTQQITREGLRPAELHVAYDVERVPARDGTSREAFDVMVAAATDALAPNQGTLLSAGPLRVPDWLDEPPLVHFTQAQSEALAEASAAIEPALREAGVPNPMLRYTSVTFAKLELLNGFGLEGMLTPAHYSCRTVQRGTARFNGLMLRFYGYYGVLSAGKVRVRQRDNTIIIDHRERRTSGAKTTLFLGLKRMTGHLFTEAEWRRLERRRLQARVDATVLIDATTGVVTRASVQRTTTLLGVKQRVTTDTTLR